ncbi:substrate-binding domain-containing protein [Haloechinothrix alba]|uniref:substrate-binding domain-containing protein n=1 Tax=Haloechinothrix alba TaxID=664784 RepID=UPI0015957F9F|nr:substrate-binding domain-containing protein [Haloechinothrix alba]
MSGRHRSGPRARRRTGTIAAAVSGLVAALVAAAGLAWGVFDGPGCGGDEPFIVDAAPSIAPALTEFAEEDLPDADGKAACLDPEIRATEPASVAGAYHADNGGPDHAGDGSTALWIPDSTLWLKRTHAEDESVPEHGSSIATSPVVLATTDEHASDVGWPDEQLTWTRVLHEDAVPGAVDPNASAASLIAVMSIGAHDWDDGTRTRIVQAMAKHAIAPSDNPFNRLPGGGTEPTVDAFPTSEQQVIPGTHEEKDSPAPIVTAYPEVPTPWLDYPAVVLADGDDERRESAELFRDALFSEAAAERLAAHGFRDVDGVLSGNAMETATGHAESDAAVNRAVRTDAGPVGPPPSSDRAESALEKWSTVSKEGRMLVVLDVSGSMNAAVPGTEVTRMEATVDAVAQGMHLLRPGTDVSHWEFGHELDGDKHHRLLSPWQEVSTHLADGLPQKLDEKVSEPGGPTALYDTTLAAYEEMLDARDEEQLSVIIIFTDGADENPDGISREELLAELDSHTGAGKAVPVVFIGLGTDVDPAELTEISEITGGEVFLSEQIGDLEEIFFDSLSALACDTPGC